MARLKQIIVFGVNIDSPNKNQVKIGKMMRPADEPINLAVQAEPVSSTINFQEYQNATEHGAPRRMAVIQGLPYHHSDRYCAFSWNHPMICPTNTKNIPRYRFINVSTVLFRLERTYKKPPLS